MTDKVQGAKDRMTMTMPRLQEALILAQEKMPDGRVFLGVMVEDKTGAGQVVVRFHGAEFFEDLAVVLGYDKTPTETDLAVARFRSENGV